jgi:hypothetical protein
MGNEISLRKIREAGCKMCDDVFCSVPRRDDESHENPWIPE